MQYNIHFCKTEFLFVHACARAYAPFGVESWAADVDVWDAKRYNNLPATKDCMLLAQQFFLTTKITSKIGRVAQFWGYFGLTFLMFNFRPMFYAYVEFCWNNARK